MSGTDSKKKALDIASKALEKKADNIVILDMRKAAAFCDYFVIASAGSLTKTRAVTDHIIDSLKKTKPYHVEGKTDGQWILIDYTDVVVHVFYEETRNFYGLERLWGDAERIEVSE